MLLVKAASFSVSDHARKHANEYAEDPLAPGPVVRIRIRFRGWRSGQSFEADAFLDPGADSSIVSWPWLCETAAPTSPADRPKIGPGGNIDEVAWVEIGGRSLRLPPRAQFCLQGDRVAEFSAPDGLAEMPGHEDVLLGRDFLVMHGCLFAVDGTTKTSTLLLPDDPSNLDRYERTLSALLGPGPG